MLARNVDVGQTVAASFQAPTLFVIANDLTRMEVNASVDEADIGRVRTGQDVTFRVDAFPDETFAGRVEQVRLQPVTNQNVVTYNTIISVDNAVLRLMPGMTATVSIVIARQEGRPARPVGRSALPARGLRGRAPGGGAPGPGGEVAPRGSPGRPSAGPGRGAVVFLLGRRRRSRSPTRVRLGLSDGRYTEVLDGLAEGARVITGAGAARAATAPERASSNPFQPARPQPRAR